MSKGYIVNRAFNSPALDVWISPDTAHLLDQMPAPELKRLLEDGHLTEVELPAGCTTVAQAIAWDAAVAEAKKAAGDQLVLESAAEAQEKAQDALAKMKEKLEPKPTPVKSSKGGK